MFTSCARTCPRTVAKLREVDEDLRRRGRTAQFVMVTLDPANDTPARLAEYKTEHGLPESWRLLVGGAEETRALAELLDVHVLDLDVHRYHEAKIVVFDGLGMSTAELEVR
jgi:protein SCO1/2